MAALEELLAAGDAFGAGTPETAEKVLVEFVSANPTGPLTARQRPPRRIRRRAGADPRAGRPQRRPRVLLQRPRLPDRPPRRVDPRPRPRRGAARGRLPGRLRRRAGAVDRRRRPRWTPPSSRSAGVESIMAGIRATLEAYRVQFDAWFLERSLHEGEPSAVERTLALLEERGHTYRSEGALWLRTSTFGDDKDRVLVRSSGETTYFANDVAYHEDKLERGYDRMINLLGSDHHGYIARMKASMSALGVEPDRLEIPILQFVHIVEGAPPRLDVQAPRRLRHARRPDRRDRRRRHALLHAQPLARLDRRPRRRARQVAGEGQPRLLRPVPPRALRVDPAPGRRSRRRRGRASSCTRPSAS